jgi:transcriptional regulator with XRE-family HTH domain
MPDDERAELLVALGQAIRELRLERGLSQEQLAERSGLHPRYISDVERGRRNIGFVNLDRLAQAMSIDLSGLGSRIQAHR